MHRTQRRNAQRWPRARALGLASIASLALAACSSGPIVQSRGDKPRADSSRASNAPKPKTTPQESDGADSKASAEPSRTASSSEGGAQSGPTPLGPPIADAGKDAPEVLYDEVIAIVDASVVTRSSVREDRDLEIEARLAELAKNGGRAKLSPAAVAEIERQLVTLRIRDILLSDSVNTLGIDPKRIETIVNRLVEDRVTEAERAAGGSLEFVERLKERGSTYESYRADLRNEIRRQLSISEKMREAGVTSQLLATPREMRAYYDKNIADFTSPSEASLELLRFRAKADRDPPSDRAKRARQDLVAGKSVEATVEARGAELDKIAAMRPDDSSLAILRNFAFDPSHAAGALSAPLPRGNEVWLLRLAGRREGGTRPFKNEKVQSQIRDALAIKRRNELWLELYEDEQRRTKIWPEDLLRR